MQLLIGVILVILEAVDPELFDPDSLKVSHYIITLVVLVWVELAVAVKRWHDRNKSALWIFFSLIPIIGQIWTLIELGFMKGTKGHNGLAFWKWGEIIIKAKTLKKGGGHSSQA